MKYNIGIIGNGFVGSAISNGFSLKANIRIYDIDKNRRTHSLQDTINLSEFIFLCLPTPMTEVSGGPIDLSIYYDCLSQIEKIYQDKQQVFIIKSTVIPGTTEQFCDRFADFNFVFNPEFLTERNANLDFINAARIVLGGPEHYTTRVEKLYRTRFPYKNIILTDYKTSEMIKYMCNCFFSTKISFLNEMMQVAKHLDVCWDSAMEGFISDGRIGNSHIEVPGHDGSLGFGGKCFPKDINAMIYFMNNIGVKPSVLQAVWDKNLEVRELIDWSEIKGAVSED